jgi:site-specific recombinase XerD
MGLAKIVFWKYQKNKSGESPIFIRIIEDRKPRYLKTGFNSTEQDWDFDNNCFRTKYRKAEEQYKAVDHVMNNELLLKKLREANNMIKTLINDDKIISSKQVKQEILKAKAIGNKSVLSFVDTLVEEHKSNGKLGTAKCYNDLKNSLKKFLKKQDKSDITFKEIDLEFLTKYENYFRERNVTGNGISFYMRSLRATYKVAIVRKICKVEMYPFNDYRISNLKEDTVKRAISKEDIFKIAQFEADPDCQMYRSKTLFLFSYYCRGINFVDMGMLKWENINGNRMTYIRQKTGKYFDLELLAPAKQILDHLKEKYYRGEDSYIFPILDESKHKTQVSIRNRLHKVLGQTNKDLKDLGKELGIKTKLTTYVARHTFATVLRKSGASYSTIKDTMGHSDEKTTQLYVDGIQNDALDIACKALI